MSGPLINLLRAEIETDRQNHDAVGRKNFTVFQNDAGHVPVGVAVYKRFVQFDRIETRLQFAVNKGGDFAVVENAQFARRECSFLPPASRSRTTCWYAPLIGM